MNNSRTRETTVECSGFNQCQIRRWLWLIHIQEWDGGWFINGVKGRGPVKVTSFFSRMLINVRESYSWCGEFNLGTRQRRTEIRLTLKLHTGFRSWNRISETRPLPFPICQHNLVGTDFAKKLSLLLKTPSEAILRFARETFTKRYLERDLE